MTGSMATSIDLEDILGLRDHLAQWLIGRGVEQWQPGELPIGVVEDQIAQGFVHIVRCQAELVAAVTIIWADPLIWPDQSQPAGDIHGLMVDRRWAGRQVGLS